MTNTVVKSFKLNKSKFQFKKQLGASMPATLVVVAFIALIITTALKMAPVYFENWQLQTILNDIETQYSESKEAGTKQSLRTQIAKRMNIDQITVISYKDIEISREGESLLISANFEKRMPLIGNVDVVMKFEENQVSVPYRN